MSGKRLLHLMLPWVLRESKHMDPVSENMDDFSELVRRSHKLYLRKLILRFYDYAIPERTRIRSRGTHRYRWEYVVMYKVLLADL